MTGGAIEIAARSAAFAILAVARQADFTTIADVDVAIRPTRITRNPTRAVDAGWCPFLRSATGPVAFFAQVGQSAFELSNSPSHAGIGAVAVIGGAYWPASRRAGREERASPKG